MVPVTFLQKPTKPTGIQDIRDSIFVSVSFKTVIRCEYSGRQQSRENRHDENVRVAEAKRWHRQYKRPDISVWPGEALILSGLSRSHQQSH